MGRNESLLLQGVSSLSEYIGRIELARGAAMALRCAVMHAQSGTFGPPQHPSLFASRSLPALRSYYKPGSRLNSDLQERNHVRTLPSITLASILFLPLIPSRVARRRRHRVRGRVAARRALPVPGHPQRARRCAAGRGPVLLTLTLPTRDSNRADYPWRCAPGSDPEPDPDMASS